MLNIHSVETFWTQEWPWIRVVFFLQGCLMKCLYCHNPDTLEFKENKLYSNEEIISIVDKVKPYFQKKWGVTFSWGECLAQAENLLPLVKELKQKWYHICIDTNWFVFNSYVEELLKYVDLVLLDIKHLFDEEHIKLTQVSNKNILEFGKYLEKNNINFWIRHVLVPTFTDDEKHLNELWKYFQNYKNLERLEILPYHTLWVHKWKELWFDYKLDHISAPSNEELLKAKNILEKYIPKVFIRR